MRVDLLEPVVQPFLNVCFPRILYDRYLKSNEMKMFPVAKKAIADECIAHSVARWSKCGSHGAGKQLVVVEEVRIVAEDDGERGAMVTTKHWTQIPTPNPLRGHEVTS